ncbi:coiled-coil domain-containing protein 18-like [Cylas formicarius]|uniref:coiled-coil domain-containing protein 18-like n=1 Tax=Cylas formicarius TaxID=197179 RepID=UPI002958694A|nr:coiled-coil domain-containing protein 18-like [Cylas formicarius]XP_060521950.1 coiled-coil domain-containing protein 18-like [Cylas formicarius]
MASEEGEAAGALDEQYKKLLCVIRNHIPYINSNTYLSQCCLWLEKLSDPSSDKARRNLYLSELAFQIRKRQLMPPFDEAPPQGDLATLDDTDSWTDLTDSGSESEVVVSQMAAAKPIGCGGREIEKIKVKKSGNPPRFIAEDWKTTVNALQLRLSETTYQNRELKAKIESDTTTYRQREEDWLRLVEESKRSLERCENEHRQTLTQIAENYERTIKGKDGEVLRLERILRQRCASMEDEISALRSHISRCSCNQKMALLRKCVSKMDKLFQRSQKESAKQIEKLQMELEKKNHTLQRCMKTQKLELLSRCSPDQEEFEKILNGLEARYKQILDLRENEVVTRQNGEVIV